VIGYLPVAVIGSVIGWDTTAVKGYCYTYHRTSSDLVQHALDYSTLLTCCCEGEVPYMFYEHSGDGIDPGH